MDPYLLYEPSHEKINNLGFRPRHVQSQKQATYLKFWIYCTIRVAKTKALISCAVTEKLIRALFPQRHELQCHFRIFTFARKVAVIRGLNIILYCAFDLI